MDIPKSGQFSYECQTQYWWMTYVTKEHGKNVFKSRHTNLNPLNLAIEDKDIVLINFWPLTWFEFHDLDTIDDKKDK
jgi:hypothetical protein